MTDVLAFVGMTVPQFIAILVTIGVFASVLATALPLLTEGRLKNRMKAVAIERETMRAQERARLANRREDTRKVALRRGEARGLAASVVERLNLRTALADEKTVASLRVAGYRGQRPLTLFLFARVVAPLVLLAFAIVYVFGLGLLADRPMIMRVAVCIFVSYLGFYAPVLFVKNKAKKRQESIQRAWPDALDLLLITVESGSAIEAGFRRVADEIGIQSIALAEELVLVCAELSYLPERKVAYDNLASRTGLESVRAVTTALIQAERYGTPLGTALRTLSQENRDIRMTLAEKKAAALPPKLTVPMILFFLPVLFGVIIGPAIIQAMGLQ